MAGSPHNICALLLLAAAVILPAMAVEGTENNEKASTEEVKSKFTEKLDENEQTSKTESTGEVKGNNKESRFDKFEKKYINPAIERLNNKYQSAEAKLGAAKESMLDKGGKFAEKVKTAGANAVDKAKLPPKADAQDETMLQKAKRKASEMSSTFITAMWEAKDKVDAYVHTFFGGAFDRAVHLIKIPENEVVLAGFGPGVAEGSKIKLHGMRVDKLRIPSFDIALKTRPQVSFKITKFHLDLHGNFSLTLKKTNIAVPLPSFEQAPGSFRINMDNIDIDLDGEFQKTTEEEDKSFMEKLPHVPGLNPDTPKHETEKVLATKPVKEEVPLEPKNEQQQIREKRAEGDPTSKSEPTTEAEAKEKTRMQLLKEKKNEYLEGVNKKYKSIEASAGTTYAELKKKKAALLEKTQALTKNKKTETNEEQKPDGSRTVEATSSTEQQGASKPKEKSEKPAKEAEGGGWWGGLSKYAPKLPAIPYLNPKKAEGGEESAKSGEAGEAKPGFIATHFSWLYGGGKGKEEDNPKGYQPRLKFVSSKTCKGSVEKFNFDIVHLSASDENGLALGALNALIDAGLPAFVNNAIRNYVCEGIALSLNEFLHNRGPKMTKLLAWAVKTPKDEKPKQPASK